MTALDATTWHIIPSRFPLVGIFDEVAAPSDVEIIAELEAATNPRVLDELGELSLVRPADRISGPGTTPIMTAFTHTSDESRFSDGTFGVYYAGLDEDTAIAETAYHRARFLQQSGLADEWLDMRTYTARVVASLDDIRPLSPRSRLYHPSDYSHARRYARKIYDADRLDGIVYRSVRRIAGACVAVFRPRCVRDCRIAGHLQYRFSGYELALVARLEVTP